MLGRFPIYVVSKGRHDNLLTTAWLEKMGVPHYVVVEAQEAEAYSDAVGVGTSVLILDKKYQEKYDTFDKLGDTKSKGPGPARNFAWDHSIEEGHAWHWVMDDNIAGFYRLHKNHKIRVLSENFFLMMEDFVLRYDNVSMAGPQYHGFTRNNEKHDPFKTNCRIYSCNLIRNDTPFRWRGRYNEDTDLSIRMMKKKWVTILFYAFLQDKTQTQKMSGGNTKEFYDAEGTYAKSSMLVRMHPDITKLVKRWGRWHHRVRYACFKKNKLHRIAGLKIEEGVNNYGLVLNARGRDILAGKRHG